MNLRFLPAATFATLLASGVAAAQSASSAPAPRGGGFARAAESIDARLEASLAELAALRERMAAELVPLNRDLAAAERRLSDARASLQERVRELDRRNLAVSTLRTEIEAREQEATYLAGLLGEYRRNFESRLHIAELQRHRDAIAAASLAADNPALSEQELALAQAALLATSLDRLEEAIGGTRFEGTAVGDGGTVRKGTFVLAGPVAIFEPEGGGGGTAETRLGSLEPALLPLKDPLDAAAITDLAALGSGELPLDATLGNAHRVEETRETFLEHVRKGGPVMIPIFALAGAAFSVALLKWIGLSTVRLPSRGRVRALLEAIGRGDRPAMEKAVARIPGPIGRMLAAGVEHFDRPRGLIEEVMFERVLATQLRLQRFLPFVAISAAAAPLLGLLGTVTGIINTFKLITVFGSGDVKTLSGGISEALVTTEFGLIVAIPSLLMHAFLSRKAKRIVDRMETVSLEFLNEIARVRDSAEQRETAEESRARLTSQVREIVAEILAPKVAREVGSGA